MNENIRIKIRADLVDGLDSLNYRYRQGELTRAEWINELHDLRQIGQSVDWDLYAIGPLTEVALTELHARTYRT